MPALARERHPHPQPRRAQRGAAALGRRASSRRRCGRCWCRSGSTRRIRFRRSPTSRSTSSPGSAARMRSGARNSDRHRQGAARAAARDPAARALGRRAARSFVLLTSVIRAHLGELFPGPRGRGVLAVPRHARLRPRGRRRRRDQPAPGAALGPDDAPLRPGDPARGRQHLPARAVGSSCCSSSGCPSAALYRVNGPVNLVRLNELIDLADAPRAALPAVTSRRWPRDGCRARQLDLRRGCARGDVLLHHPFEIVRAGGAVPARGGRTTRTVLAIKQTIYRTGSESPLMDLLIEAARRGKEVMAVVELKARFDEEANINWAERLEAVGAQVVYGVVGLKTHAKLLLVTRREGRRGLRRYAHLSTGNYNPQHRAALHRRRLPDRRPGPDRRRRRGVPAARQPRPAAAAAPPAAGAVHAAPADAAPRSSSVARGRARPASRRASSSRSTR